MLVAPFVHLRNHTAYSLAEGALTSTTIVSLCKEFNMPAVAITDTNNLFGGAEFSTYMTKDGIQPIIGTQIDVDFDLPPSVILPHKYSQLILLVQTETGYKNLLKILSHAYLKKELNQTPHIKFSELVEYNNGIIALSGGVKGIVGNLILAQHQDLAKQKCIELKELFNNRFYIELQRHDIADEIRCEQDFLNLAYELNIPIVATNECYFKNKDIYQAHDVLLCITDGRYIDEENRRRESQQHYFKSQKEMIDLFSDLPEAIENTIKIAKRCSFKVKKSKPLLPHVNKDIDEETLLRNNSKKGLEERLRTINIINQDEQKEYFDRLEYELGIIIQMGFPGYFLIVADFIGWAKANNIPVGPGRGSGAGSIVAWSLKITDLNPLQFGLLFERFLNPDRVSMPDFDIDFCQDRRGEVIQYIQGKYGFDSVGQIITFGKLQAKAVIKDVGRVLRIPYGKCDDLCKLIPFRIMDNDKNIPVSISNVMANIPDFKDMIENDDVLKVLIKIALQLEGLYRNPGTHAAGVVIGDRPLDELVALYKDEKSDIPVTQYNMKFIEDTGLVKYDFLGLKTLTIIQKACDMIKLNHNIQIDISNIPIDDKKTYELISSGNTAGIFQLESRGMQDVISDLKPNRIEDLIALVSLYRPGPMESIPTYIKRKFGEPIDYPHPLMEPILRETYGIMVYQEQVMEMGRVLAGYTLGGADLLRRAMGKKIASEMEKQRQIFKEGCLIHNNIDEKTSMKIFDLMERFANYGFNKSHAACYAWISYQTAYLKANFTSEFMAATLTYDMNDAEKLAFFAENIRKMKIKILPPSINKSHEYFTVENGNIRYAMAGIKGIGIGVVQTLRNEREKNGEFKSITDFINRMEPKNLNTRTIENLALAGGFDEFEPNRAKMYGNAQYIISYILSINKDRETNQTSLFATNEMETTRDDIRLSEHIDFKPLDRLKKEQEVIGFYLSSHPLQIYENTIKSLRVTKTNELEKITQDCKITLAGIVDSIKSKLSKAGKKYLLATISDTEGSIEVLFFERAISNPQLMQHLGSGNPVVISCDLKYNIDRISLFGSGVEELTLNSQISGTLNIKLNHIDAIPALKKTLSGIPPGYTYINIQIEHNNKLATIPLGTRYNITTENLELFKTINNIEIAFQ